MKYKMSFDFKIIDVFFIVLVALLWFIGGVILVSLITKVLGNFLAGIMLMPLAIFISSIATLIHIIKYVIEGITLYPIEENKNIILNKELK